MNIPLSLLIYNPIEAYALTLLCDIITGNNTWIKKDKIFIIYFLGFINFIIQEIPNIFEETLLYIFMQLICEYILISITMFIFYPILRRYKIKKRQCVIAQFINSVFIIVISSIVGFVLNIVDMFYIQNMFHEFVANTFIFSVQISLYTFIKLRSINYEKCCKGSGRKFR